MYSLKMYSLDNSIREIFSDGLEKRGFYIFCPKYIVDVLSEEQKEIPLKVLKETVTMPWGAPYFSDVVVAAANLLLQVESDRTLEFVEIWSEKQKENWLPVVGDDKKGVCLLARTAESIKNDDIRPAAIVCPGGAYMAVDFVKEGFLTAQELEKAGYRVFILRYRLLPNRYPCPQIDLALAIKYIRANADEYRIDANDLMAVGFSAGGHLTASETLYASEIDDILMKELHTNYPELAAKYRGISVKANKLTLCYPVISLIENTNELTRSSLTNEDESLIWKLSVELHADGTFPQTFVWANDDDPDVPPDNAGRLAKRLKEAGVNVCYRAYESGGHGCGLGTGTSCEGWLDEMVRWMKNSEI